MGALTVKGEAEEGCLGGRDPFGGGWGTAAVKGASSSPSARRAEEERYIGIIMREDI